MNAALLEVDTSTGHVGFVREGVRHKEIDCALRHSECDARVSIAGADQDGDQVMAAPPTSSGVNNARIPRSGTVGPGYTGRIIEMPLPSRCASTTKQKAEKTRSAIVILERKR